MTTPELTQAAHDLIDDLVELRYNRGLTQRQVAARMGTSPPNVSCFEHKRRMPGLSLILRYADAGARISPF